ncbi:PadR family transcriptional regulator [Chamaesiphon sp. OTE_75_metabat_556]|uniref:PadR family transcriptional regulator n=1 Tax=Chamaesiphon sp. OTE_75_metabat_556 TaxID=2964692 RepID=UPI00286ADED9|nr:PadR family transcriptional regulator [Chamaesiphon sp. OTE_75_metabat_556]
MSLSHAILAAISNQSCSGYDLAKKFDGSIGFFWNATHQQIYRELIKLEKQSQIKAKLIHQEHRPDKKIYSLTSAGEEFLRKWIETPSTVGLLKDDLLVKIFAGSVVSPQILVVELKHHYTQHLESLHIYEALAGKHFTDRSQLSDVGRYQYITLRQGIRLETEWLAWCEEAIELLGMSSIMGTSDRELLEAHPKPTQTDLDNAWVYTETCPDEIANAISANEAD